MGKIRNYNKSGKIVKWNECTHPLLEAIVDTLVLLFSIVTTVIGLRQDIFRWWLGCLITVLIIVTITIYKISSLIRQIRHLKTYEQYKKSQEVSVATLQAAKDAHVLKRRTILQSTYGTVPKWHPTNYIDNVLVYDVHEHIRSILYGLQKLIINTTDTLNDDEVTVDLIYCYPSDGEYNGTLPMKVPVEEKQETKKKDEIFWHLITAGNHSLSGSINSFLCNSGSFYCHVDTCGYSFYNDKMECINDGHYILSEKDSEYKNTGSIIGLKIELKCDEPEDVFIKAILTITTYGSKIYENKNNRISEEEYKAIIKKIVLSSYRSQLMSELSQMYIRHAIRDGRMCPRTGQINNHGKQSRCRTCAGEQFLHRIGPCQDASNCVLMREKSSV